MHASHSKPQPSNQMERLPYATACFPYHFRCAKCKGRGERGWAIFSPCNCLVCLHCYSTALTSTSPSAASSPSSSSSSSASTIDLSRCWICSKPLSAARASWLAEVGTSFQPHAPAQCISYPVPEVRDGIFSSYVGGGYRGVPEMTLEEEASYDDTLEDDRQMSLHDYKEATRFGPPSETFLSRTLDKVTGQVREAFWLTNALSKGVPFHQLVEIKATYLSALTWVEAFAKEELWLMPLLRTHKFLPHHFAALRMTWLDIKNLQGPLPHLFEIWNPSLLRYPMDFWARTLKTIPDHLLSDFAPPVDLVRKDKLQPMDLSSLGFTWRHIREATLKWFGVRRVGWTELSVRALRWSPLDWKYMGVVTWTELDALAETLEITKNAVAMDLGFPMDIKETVTEEQKQLDVFSEIPRLPLPPAPSAITEEESPLDANELPQQLSSVRDHGIVQRSSPASVQVQPAEEARSQPPPTPPRERMERTEPHVQPQRHVQQQPLHASSPVQHPFGGRGRSMFSGRGTGRGRG